MSSTLHAPAPRLTGTNATVLAAVGDLLTTRERVTGTDITAQCNLTDIDCYLALSDLVRSPSMLVLDRPLLGRSVDPARFVVRALTPEGHAALRGM